MQIHKRIFQESEDVIGKKVKRKAYDIHVYRKFPTLDSYIKHAKTFLKPGEFALYMLMMALQKMKDLF